MLWKCLSWRSPPLLHRSFRFLSHVSEPQRNAPPSLETLIAQSIRASGPLSVASYMSLCLSHPNDGYYTAKEDTIGRKGDFITSPEISQVFGELIALWLVDKWMKRDPSGQSPIRLIELGPGRGTLLQDMLRTMTQFPGVDAALKDVCLVEMSPKMRDYQALAVRKYGDRNIAWANHLEEFDTNYDGFTILVAHEFFDSLPVQIFEKRKSGFHEVRIDLQQQPSQEPPDSSKSPLDSNTPLALRYVLDPSPSPLPGIVAKYDPAVGELAEGGRLELSPLSVTAVQQVADVIKNSTQGGAALVIDYGYENLDSGKGMDTFRAFKDHKQVDPLDKPGSVDLTCSVNFKLLKAAVNEALSGDDKAKVFGPMSQASFLMQIGFQLRLAQLIKNAKNDDDKKRIYQAATRLVSRGPNGMGRQYFFMGITNGLIDGFPFEQPQEEY